MESTVIGQVICLGGITLTKHEYRFLFSSAIRWRYIFANQTAKKDICFLNSECTSCLSIFFCYLLVSNHLKFNIILLCFYEIFQHVFISIVELNQKEPFPNGFHLSSLFEEDECFVEDEYALMYAQFCSKRATALQNKRELCHICFFDLGKVVPVKKDEVL